MYADSVAAKRGLVITLPLMFDVLVKHVAQYMSRNEDWTPNRAEFQYSVVIIDEGQDVSPVQLYIIKELHKRYGKESFAVVLAYDRLQG